MQVSGSVLLTAALCLGLSGCVVAEPAAPETVTVTAAPDPPQENAESVGLSDTEVEFLSGIARGFRDQPDLLAWPDEEWLTRGYALCSRMDAGDDLGAIINEAMAANPDSAFITVGVGTEATFTLCPEHGAQP